MLLRALAWLVLAVGSMAEYDLTFDEDPYLQYRPPFVRSLPVQILLTGVVLTLTTVLFLYLIFTAQYHWPLAPVNYILQVSSVTTLLISLIATLQVVLSTCNHESKRWPFMLSYVAVNVPPLDGYTVTVGWNLAERATWLIMNATTSGLIQITHIQFLTLLYPSKTEGVLIFSMLGPLAVLAAIMQLLPLQGSPGLDNIAAAIRNVCNATLSLLFTVALFVWGLLVNRDQAWRTDGGTAGFGSAALLLAVASTALTFLYIPREAEYVWLPGLIWAVVQWQSFLGWWWWVGAGSGTGMPRYDDSDYLEERERKREKRKAPGGSRGRARRAWQNVFASLSDRREALETDYDDSVRRPRRRNSNSRSPPRTTPTTGVADPRSTSDVYSDSSGTLPRVLPDVVHRWYASLRKAHNKAARKQAMERVEYLRDRQKAGAPPSTHTGWGLGSYGLRIRQEEGREDSQRSHGVGSPPVGESIELSEMATGEDGNTFENRLENEVADDPANNNLELRQRTTAGVGRSIWWWGPLRRWRLQESIVY